jgi:hypothetical protein
LNFIIASYHNENIEDNIPFIFGANPCELNQLEAKIDGKTLCPNHKQVIRPPCHTA